MRSAGCAVICIAITARAIAAIDHDSALILCADLPVIHHDKLTSIDATKLTVLIERARDVHRAARISIERTRPGYTPQLAFAEGLMLGSVLATCQRMTDVPLDMVVTARFHEAMELGSLGSWGAYRLAAFDRARALFPRANTNGKRGFATAEVLLLAEYSRRVWAARAESAAPC